MMGEARFIEPKVVEVRMNTGEIRILTANTIFINAGDRPSIPPIDGIENVPTLDSTSIMELDSVPEHLLVFGGSYIALEFGQMFRRFGSKVTIIQRSAHLLSREDTDIADEVAKILREDGIEILLESSVSHVSQNLNGSIEMALRTAGDEQIMTGSHLLVAAGRIPNTDWLNLEAAGIETDKRGFIRVNDRLETNVPGIYALGDIKGGPAFTHISYDDFRIIRTNVLEHGKRKYTRPPGAIYSVH